MKSRFFSSPPFWLNSGNPFQQPAGFLTLVIVLALATLVLMDTSYSHNPPAPASPRTIIDYQFQQLNLGPLVTVHEDREGKLNFDRFFYGSEPVDWSQNTTAVPAFGFTRNPVWLHAALTRLPVAPKKWLLEIGYPLIDELHLYVVIDGELSQIYHLGDQLPHHKRPQNHRFFIIPLIFDNTTPAHIDLYLQAQTTGALQIPLRLWNENHFYELEQHRLLLIGLAYGILLVIIIYNLFLFVPTRDRSYLWFVALVLSLAGCQATLEGLTFQYLWPESIWWQNRSMLFFVATSLVASVFFIDAFLEPAKCFPSLGQYRHVFKILSVIFLAATLVFPLRSALVLNGVTALVFSFGILLLTTQLWMTHRVAGARLFTLAWLAFLAFAFVAGLSRAGILPTTLFTEHAILLGTLIQVILLSYALADRIKREREKRLQAQARMLESERQLRLAQENTLTLQQKMTEELERRVEERTQALHEANQRLESLSTIDGLTGVKNRRFFDHALETSCKLAFRTDNTLTILLVDVDHFKQFNDTYGHLAGDECLRIVAKVIESRAARASDTVARYGGEEFVVLLQNTRLEAARHIAESIRLAIAETPVHFQEQVLNVTASIGVACSLPGSDPSSFETVLQQADEALYEAKAYGRNCVKVSRVSLAHLQ